ncbi:MAG TPA: cytochrome P450 [Burkholderiaceae bacterium]|nr:cytochrome P450 [Burkholderiaceae bacterium]
MSDTIGKGFSLVMELEDPARLLELMGRLDDPAVKPRIQKALASLDYVHYARFLPLWDRGLLMIITEFDGAMADYVMDFAAALDAEFSLILSYMKGKPPLPVSRYPRQFWEYVDRNTGPKSPDPLAYPDPFSAYPGRTALDIAGGARPKVLPEPPPRSDAIADARDVQGHVLHGYRARCARHVGFAFADAARGAAMLRELLPMVSADSERGKPFCITLGLTHAGLQALGLPQGMLEQFPIAFREGPRLRKERLGDVGRSDPEHWTIAGFEGDPTPLTLGRRTPVVVHGMVSVYTTGDAKALADRVLEVEAAMKGRARACFEMRADAIGDLGEIHFGYRDGIGQPRFPGAAPPPDGSAVPRSSTGDLLLGRDYRNSRGGYHIGELPPELATNGTYAALRVIEQDVRAFEHFLRDVQRRHGVDPELTAAKLVGRWRNGSALARYPDRPDPQAPHRSSSALDEFDYAGPDAFDDREGRRCPFGAHVRRLNPRSGMVLGVPWGRRIVRRGMPYGPKFDPERPDDTPRGLVGLFLCADLESQFEFMQHVWANQDLSAPGLRHTQDPFSSARDGATTFRFRPVESRDEIEVQVPPLTRTIGSAYLFMPGRQALRCLATAGWAHAAPTPEALLGAVPRKTGAPMAAPVLDATSAQFFDNPYAEYARVRQQAPVAHVGPPYHSWWVLSAELVAQCNAQKELFLKPGGTRTGGHEQGPFGVVNHQKDGLFFMDPPRHTEVRAIMDKVFAEATANARDIAAQAAERLLDAAQPRGQMDAIMGYAGPLASQVFFQVMGVPPGKDGVEWAVVDGWIRAALDAHRATMPTPQRLPGATAGFAMRTYFMALGDAAAAAGDRTAATSIIAGIHRHTGCPASKTQLDPVEAMNTAVHFALGGYLSTQFLIGSGLRNLLTNPAQWQALCGQGGLTDAALDELLRFDAPFQLADRWVADDVTLGGVPLAKGSVIALVYGSANRDPALCSAPDAFDTTREHIHHFGFGDGIHRCIGEPLARIVTKAAIDAIIKRCPGSRIGEVGPWAPDPYFRSLTRLQLLLQ